MPAQSVGSSRGTGEEDRKVVEQARPQWARAPPRDAGVVSSMRRPRRPATPRRIAPASAIAGVAGYMPTEPPLTLLLRKMRSGHARVDGRSRSARCDRPSQWPSASLPASESAQSRTRSVQTPPSRRRRPRPRAPCFGLACSSFLPPAWTSSHALTASFERPRVAARSRHGGERGR